MQLNFLMQLLERNNFAANGDTTFSRSQKPVFFFFPRFLWSACTRVAHVTMVFMKEGASGFISVSFVRRTGFSGVIVDLCIYAIYNYAKSFVNH